MLEFFGDAIGAIVGGGATGLLGSAISVWGEFKKNQLLFDHQQKMKDLDTKAMRMEAELELKKVETEGEISMAIEETRAMANSYEHDKATYYKGELGKFGRALMVFVDFFRGMIRPSMTTYLVVLTTMIFWEVQDLVNGLEGGITNTQAMALLQQIIMVILYITATVVLWWFGTRQKIIKGA